MIFVGVVHQEGEIIQNKINNDDDIEIADQRKSSDVRNRRLSV